MTFSLRGAVAVITGAGSGIGAALAVILAKRGAALALVDLNRAGLETTAAEARRSGVIVTAHVLDVADKAAVAALPDAVLAAHGRVNVLVNNAGVALGGTFEEVSETDFDWLMAINFEAVVRITRAFLPVLRREPAAHIVNVSSLFGLIAPVGQTAYSASKFAVRGFSEALRHELESSPITLTVVHPGGVKTGIAANARRSGAMTNAEVEEQTKRYERLLSLSPEVAAESIAKAIEARAKRLVIGKDAKQAAFIQWLFPVGYWSIIKKQAG